jgi:hypothetical protein
LAFLNQSLQDFIGATLQILVGLLVELAMVTDKMDEEFFIQSHD